MKKSLLIFTLLVLILPTLVFSQVIIRNPLEADTLEEIINNIIDFLFSITIVVVPLMIIFAAFLFATSAGNIAQIDRAKRIIMWTLVGFAIVLLSKGILAIIERVLGV